MPTVPISHLIAAAPDLRRVNPTFLAMAAADAHTRVKAKAKAKGQDPLDALFPSTPQPPEPPNG